MTTINRYLEDELKEALSSLNLGSKTDRNVSIVVSYLGLDGLGGKKGNFSMEAVGNPYGLTREMVRQITNKATVIAKTFSGNLPKLKQAKDLIESSMPFEASYVENKLQELGISRGVFRIEGVINALEIFGIKSSIYQVVDHKQGRFVVANEKQEELPAKILSKAGALVSHNGACNVSELLKDVSCKKENKLSFVLGIISSRNEKDLRWIDESQGWFYFTEVKRNRVLKRVKKVFSVCESVQVASLLAAIKRSFEKDKNDKFHLLENEIMMKLLELTGDFTVEVGGIIKAIKRFEDVEILKDYEQLIVDEILKSPTGTVREGELEKIIVYSDINEVDEDDMKLAKTRKYGFSVALNFSPVILKVKRGVYALAGTPYKD